MTWLAENELRLRLRDLESQWIERKQSAAERSGIHRNICAFANDLSGSDRVGVIFVGLKDDGRCTGLSAIRLYLQGIRASGPDAARARRAEFTPIKWGNAEAMGMVILAIWPVAKSAIEARPCTDLAAKCPPGIKPSGLGWRPDQLNRGKNRRRRPCASVSRSRAGGKAILRRYKSLRGSPLAIDIYT